MTTTTTKHADREVKFFYLHDPKHRGRTVTIARRVNAKGTKMHVGVATYHYDTLDKVPFTKEIGRNIATGRLNKDPLKIKLGSDTTPLRTAVRAVADASDDTVVCQTTRRLAQDWLATDALRTQAFTGATQERGHDFHAGPFTSFEDRKEAFDDQDDNEDGMDISEIDEHNSADAHEDMADRRRKDSSG